VIVTMTTEETVTTDGVQITMTVADANRLRNTLETLETIMFAAFRDNALMPYAHNPLQLAEQIAAFYDLISTNTVPADIPTDTPRVPIIPRQPGALDPNTQYTVRKEIGQQEFGGTGRYQWMPDGELLLTPAEFNSYDIPKSRNNTDLGIQTRCRLLLFSTTGKIIRERYGA
jgi:hypothetical protein